MPQFSGARVLVVGDVMLDRYWHGDTSRISPEAPVPVVHVARVEARPGGAANVAVNAAALGVQVTLLALVGEDEAGIELRGLLDATGVRGELLGCADTPTICKMRVVSRHQQLIRLDVERPWQDARVHARLTERFSMLLGEHDLVILSDYAKGTLADPAALIDAARARRVPVLVDPKGVDFGRYRGATGLTPNLAELEAVQGHCADEATLVQRAAALRTALDVDWLLVTRGEDGMSLFKSGQPPRHERARAREVFDVTGAGDTVIAVLGSAVAAGEGVERAMELANVAAGMVVSRLGTASVTAADLQAALHGPQAPRTGVVAEPALLALLAESRAAGESLVFTNGCFDILHAGHVACLQQARRFGDRLLVAVNDDDSVRRLKGAGRPVNGLAERMAVLAGLAAVDWVVAFSEDTPARLIECVLPDVLVKGGDYREDEIVGAGAVRAAGGRVERVELLPGLSTTALLRSITAQAPGSS